MPEKDPIHWTAAWHSLPEPIKAAVIGAGVALIRVMYDDREPRIMRRLLEATLCGAIALSVATLAEALGLPAGYSTFAGGAVGLLGADQVREWGRALAQKRIDRETRHHD